MLPFVSVLFNSFVLLMVVGFLLMCLLLLSLLLLLTILDIAAVDDAVLVTVEEAVEGPPLPISILSRS